MATFYNEYTTSQTNLDIITPMSGKKVIVWSITVESDGDTTLDFSTSSQSLISGELDNGGRYTKETTGTVGDVDEPLTLSCGTNTIVSVLYDEV